MKTPKQVREAVQGRKKPGKDVALGGLTLAYVMD